MDNFEVINAFIEKQTRGINRSIWMRFADDVKSGEYHPDNIEENIIEITKNIESVYLQKSFIGCMSHMKNYNPYFDSINIEQLPFNMQSTITKIREFLKSDYGFEQELQIGKQSVFCAYETDEICNALPVLKDTYDVVIVYMFGKVEIYCKSNDIAYRMYQRIAQREDYWEIGQDYVITKAKRTGFDLKNTKLLSTLLLDDEELIALQEQEQQVEQLGNN